MSKCCQCGNEGLYKVGGKLLCVDCTLKVQQIADAQQAHYAKEINYLTAEIEAITGFPMALPSYEIPRPIIHNAPITFNNIKVDKSIVGSINTGNVHNIDVAMTNLKNGGNEALAGEIAKFTEAIANDSKADKDLKNEILEYISYVSTQVSLPTEKRKPSMLKTVLAAINKCAGSVADWITIWTTLQPMIMAAIGGMK